MDADILQYELGFAAEAFWKFLLAEKGEEDFRPPPWELVENQLHARVNEIVQGAGATSLKMFFTGKGNFRERISTTGYKLRSGVRPYHYKNIKAYIKSVWEYEEEDGLEADDLISIAMTEHPGEFICCTRDKDLRAVPGWHYGWELHKQPSFGPALVDEVGSVALSPKRDKCVGTGAAFFHYQLLLGDPVDSIVGLPGTGAVGAFKIISPATTIPEMEQAVVEAYKGFYEDAWLPKLLENGRLLHMTRIRKGNHIKLYSPSFHHEEWMDFTTGEIVATG